jgi:hypothetical protein
MEPCTRQDISVSGYELTPNLDERTNCTLLWIRASKMSNVKCETSQIVDGTFLPFQLLKALCTQKKSVFSIIFVQQLMK